MQIKSQLLRFIGRTASLPPAQFRGSGVGGRAELLGAAYLVDLVLRGLEGLDDGLQLQLAGLQALFQLALLLLQPAQLGFGPVQLLLLVLQVRLLGVDLSLQRGDLPPPWGEMMETQQKRRHACQRDERGKENRVVKEEWKEGHRGQERKQEINNKAGPESD